ncbi:hypothetical protein [Fictibacillus sp. S7]|uniref:hypothetical protein n=1 Tax=Fictibacillus sp. S7 TaxID=2212476 RepID=UPI00101248DF|nr:hypothetical protein [Fictibacillus sp. S7]RXZ00947.1 hypothetical protein DMO16_15555 [Fictibacillus sp. S7]
MYLILSVVTTVTNFLSSNADLLKVHLPAFLRIIIPLSMTIYLFAYKERKDITYSYLRSKKLSGAALTFIIFSIAISLFFYLDHFLKFKNLFFDVLLIVLSLGWGILLLILYFEIFNSVSIFHVFDNNLDSIIKDNQKTGEILTIKQRKSNDLYQKAINSKWSLFQKYWQKRWVMVDKKLKKKLSKRFGSIDISVQITSQILMSKIKYNLPKEFSENLSLLIKELDEFIKITTKLNLEHIASLNLLGEFLNVYNSILRNIELLTEYSSKNGKSKDLETLITFFNSATIGPYVFTETFNKAYLITERVNLKDFQQVLNSFRYSYIQTVKSLTFTLSNNKYWDEMLLLRNMKNLSDEADSSSSGSFTSEEVFTLYSAFLIEAINKNDIKLLTDTVNLILEQTSERIESVTKIFLLCSTKAIELGHYKCAGHLIKMIILNTDAPILKSTVEEIYQHLNNRPVFNGYEFTEFCSNLDKKMITDFMISIPFSSVSFEYCFSKLVFMLGHQQRFKMENPLPALKFEDFEFETPIEYIRDKVIDLHKEYGLVALKHQYISKS